MRRFPPGFLQRQLRLTWLRGHLTVWCQHHRGFCCHLLLPTDRPHAHTYSACTWPSTACTSVAPSISLGLLVPSDLLGQRQCWAPAPLLWSLFCSHGQWRRRTPTHRAFTDFTFSNFLIKQKLEEENAYAKQASSFFNEHRNGSHATCNAEMKERKSCREREQRGAVLPPLRHGKRSAAIVGPPASTWEGSAFFSEHGREAGRLQLPSRNAGTEKVSFVCSWRNRNVILGTQLPLVLLNWDPP